MEIEGESLDDILMKLYGALPSEGMRNTGSRGETMEIIGVALRIRNPRARLSRSENRGKLFSALGELLWYLTGKNDLSFIKKYIPKYEDEADRDGTIHGGYGPRLFAMRETVDQIASVMELLKDKSSSRRAVIQLFNAEDISTPHREVPCTTTIQFFVREKRLHMATTLRSNDAFKGLPHDVFCFTMLQEMMACGLGVDLGEYYQYVGSMHVYTDDVPKMQGYITEGYHKMAEMPVMPLSSPFDFVPLLLGAERRLRDGEDFEAASVTDAPYWADLIRLLQAFYANSSARLDELLTELANPIYRVYVESRRTRLQMDNRV